MGCPSVLMAWKLAPPEEEREREMKGECKSTRVCVSLQALDESLTFLYPNPGSDMPSLLLDAIIIMTTMVQCGKDYTRV